VCGTQHVDSSNPLGVEGLTESVRYGFDAAADGDLSVPLTWAETAWPPDHDGDRPAPVAPNQLHHHHHQAAAAAAAAGHSNGDGRNQPQQEEQTQAWGDCDGNGTEEGDATTLPAAAAAAAAAAAVRSNPPKRSQAAAAAPALDAAPQRTRPVAHRQVVDVTGRTAAKAALAAAFDCVRGGDGQEEQGGGAGQPEGEQMSGRDVVGMQQAHGEERGGGGRGRPIKRVRQSPLF